MSKYISLSPKVLFLPAFCICADLHFICADFFTNYVMNFQSIGMAIYQCHLMCPLILCAQPSRLDSPPPAQSQMKTTTIYSTSLKNSHNCVMHCMFKVNMHNVGHKGKLFLTADIANYFPHYFITLHLSLVRGT